MFFEGKKELSLRARLDFIEIAYHFIELKLLELVPSTFTTLTSKDGLDGGGTSICGLMAFLAIGQGRKWSAEEFEAISRMVFGPTLLHRERVVHKEFIERLHGMIQLLEEKKGFLSSFEPLFSKTTLESAPQFYKENEEQ